MMRGIREVGVDGVSLDIFHSQPWLRTFGGVEA